MLLLLTAAAVGAVGAAVASAKDGLSMRYFARLRRDSLPLRCNKKKITQRVLPSDSFPKLPLVSRTRYSKISLQLLLVCSRDIFSLYGLDSLFAPTTGNTLLLLLLLLLLLMLLLASLVIACALFLLICR